MPPTAPLDLPDVVRDKALAAGSDGRAWLAELPELVADLERRWSITVEASLTGGTDSYVARTRTAGGGEAILKVAVPGGGFGQQVATLASARGHGYVRLLEHDLECRALLTEALGPSLDRLGLPPERQLDVLCQTLRPAWQVSLSAAPVPTPEEEKARALSGLVRRLWDDLGRPCSRRVVDRALAYAGSRAAAFDLDRCVVVHGDPHPANTLRVRRARSGAESGFVFVDPDGFLADPAYDLGVALRDWCPQLLAGDAPALAARYCDRLAARSGVDRTAIWEWGFLERVSTGLYALSFHADDLGLPYLRTAELLV